MNAKKEVYTFLKQNNMLYSELDMDKCAADLMNEMEKGLSPKGSSLPMLPSYMKLADDLPVGEKVIVLDAGGTNLRVGLVSFNEKKEPVIENFSKHPMPGTTGKEVKKDDFFKTLADFVLPYTHESSKIGFCFSYPTEMTPEIDGKMIKLTKEIKVGEILGLPIGENLKKALKDAGCQADISVVILNDTTATLLAGIASGQKSYGSYIGCILGTGFNSAYVEKNGNIKKIDNVGDPEVGHIVNMESASFNLMQRGMPDISMDSKIASTGDHVLEKMMSGGYFGMIVSETLELAFAEGVFSKEAVAEIGACLPVNTLTADNYLHNSADRTNALVASVADFPEDAEKMFFLIDALLERAAKLMASVLSGIMVKTEAGKNPLKSLCLTIDGTTFYAYNQFRYRMERYIREFFQEKDDVRFYEIQRVDDAPLLGAAIAALTNA